MADTVTSEVLYSDNYRYVLHLTNLSDGTGESGVIKVDKSAQSMFASGDVDHIAIERVHGYVYGFTYIQLLFDHTADDIALTLGPGNFDLDLSEYGGIHDPKSAGGTGDLLLTTTGASANDLYDITIVMRFYE